MTRKVTEISTQVGEINRNRDSNLLIHGLPTQVSEGRILSSLKYNLISKDNENLDTLIKLMSDLVRTRLGIGREISLVDVARWAFFAL